MADENEPVPTGGLSAAQRIAMQDALREIDRVITVYTPETGTPVHCTTRDGFKKRIMNHGSNGETVSIARDGVRTLNLGERIGTTGTTLQRIDFTVTKKKVTTDMRTGRETTEYWAEEV